MGFREFAKQKQRLLLLGVIVASALAVGFTYTRIFVYSSSGGSLSPYLLGYYDLRTNDCIGAACASQSEDGNHGRRAGIMTNQTDVAVDLANPTSTPLLALISVFNNSSGALVGCTTETLEANVTRRVYVNQKIFNSNGDGLFGLIKIVTFLLSSPTKVQAGVKGTITHYVTESSDAGHQLILTRQSQLQQVPVEVLKRDNGFELSQITGCG